jgi:hypothetical protein
MPDDGRGAGHEYAAQALVAGSRDARPRTDLEDKNEPRGPSTFRRLSY